LGGKAHLGVQQPYEFYTTSGVEDNRDVSLFVTVFPNPTQSIITLKIENQHLENTGYQLYDLQGKLISTGKISATHSEIPMQSLGSGTYVLKVMNAGALLESFTIIKNQ
jgi:hypothetical protein